jgi:hypothetical protein
VLRGGDDVAAGRGGLEDGLDGIDIRQMDLLDGVGNPVESGGTINAVEGVGKSIPGFNQVESNIINEAKGIMNSADFAKIRAAHNAGQSITVIINGRIIQYEPGLNASGMTMFGENGFLIGNEAFSTSSELGKTVLHELHRLNTSSIANGASAELVAQETQAAFDFANKAIEELNK